MTLRDYPEIELGEPLDAPPLDALSPPSPNDPEDSPPPVPPPPPPPPGMF